MDANAWKSSVTGENCPPWCTHADHSAEDAGTDTIVHLSQAAAVRFPPTVSGELLNVSFAMSANETFQEQGTPRQPQIHFGVDDAKGHNQLTDYLPVRTRAELDTVLAGLDRVAGQLRAWRELLPENAQDAA
ncbi:DUF6907 domain-containing protein [Streptomyces sp. NPDC056883]|uniref:DUF6907 domain-containing protein n=1 Tax=Streptomyces sp. NPDC056883 TaxID=3345959 RepID=UPI00368E3D45